MSLWRVFYGLRINMSKPGHAACRYCARQLPAGAADQACCAACKKEPGAARFTTCLNCGFQIRDGAVYVAKHTEECIGSKNLDEYAGVIFVEHYLRAAARSRRFSNYKREGGHSHARASGDIPPTTPD